MYVCVYACVCVCAFVVCVCARLCRLRWLALCIFLAQRVQVTNGYFVAISAPRAFTVYCYLDPLAN